MTRDYLTLGDILAIHADQITTYGGAGGIRDQAQAPFNWAAFLSPLCTSPGLVTPDIGTAPRLLCIRTHQQARHRYNSRPWSLGMRTIGRRPHVIVSPRLCVSVHRHRVGHGGVGTPVDGGVPRRVRVVRRAEAQAMSKLARTVSEPANPLNGRSDHRSAVGVLVSGASVSRCAGLRLLISTGRSTNRLVPPSAQCAGRGAPTGSGRRRWAA